jgi:transcriptional regulator with XRE-family HTH domain
MRKPKIRLSIFKEDQGFTATGQWRTRYLNTYGENWKELQAMIIDMLNLSFEDKGYTFTIKDVSLSYDLKSFFEFYRVINAKVLAERIGMNQSLLAQYIHGIKKPSQTQIKRILKGVHEIGKELTEIDLLERVA